MASGLSSNWLLQFHVIISLIGIASGLIALAGLLSGKLLRGWTALFLATTVLTSASGFPLPPFGLDPPRMVGILSLVLLAIAIAALYGFHLVGAWRWIYVGTAVASLYLNCFVAVAQAFQKLSFLKPLAPTQSEPPFVVAQLVVLAAFVVCGVLAVRAFHPAIRAAA